jgi:transposase
LYVGLDVHKESIEVATCQAGRGSKPEHLGVVGGGTMPVTKALRRLVSRGAKLHVVYEAGPCGFALHRHLAAQVYRCEVIAPSSIPRSAGERVKTDRRDAMKLARQASLGELTVVRVPDANAPADVGPRRLTS